MRRFRGFFSAAVWLILLMILLAGCGAGGGAAGSAGEPESGARVAEESTGLPGAAGPSGAQDTGPAWQNLQKTGSMELRYAEMFAVDYFEAADGGRPYALVTFGPPDREQSRCLLVPEGQAVPSGLEENITALCLPLDHLYLASSSVMDFWRQLDALDAVSMTSTKEGDWSMPEVQEAIRSGSMRYAGKYSAPDYEALLRDGCRLAIENTMIYHSPETAEKLEAVGIPVLVEYSSYESHPLGRLEWIRLYGLMAGRGPEAEAFFEQKTRQLEGILSGMTEPSGKTAAFFYVTANGNINIHKPGGYVMNMIEMAGGTSVFTDLPEDDSALSTMNLQMEQFYRQGKDADILLYNCTVDGELQDLNDLLGKSALFSDFKAVQNGNVWCTGKNMFQETTCASDMILELHSIFSGEAGDGRSLRYLRRLEQEQQE